MGVGFGDEGLLRAGGVDAAETGGDELGVGSAVAGYGEELDVRVSDA